MHLVSSALVAACTAWNVAGLVAVWRATRPVSDSSRLLPVSVLKPLSGADSELHQNLKSFFEQDHPQFELVFGATDATDPALDTVARLQREFPTTRCRVVTHTGGAALNPKVRNLLGMLPHARHDLILISDSNVRAPRHYLSELVRVHEQSGAGIVTNLFAGSDENTLGGALENVQLNGFCAAGAALPTLSGDAAVIGKSTLFSHTTLNALGGLERLSCVLAEDFILGKMFENGGKRVVFAPTVLCSPNRQLKLGASLARHLRWSMLRFRLRPVAAVLEPVTSPLAMLPFAWLLFGPWSVAWAILLLVLRDVGGWVVLRGLERAWLPLVLSPLRELCALAIWCVAPLKRHITWRGRRLRLSAGTLLYAEPLRR